MKRSKFLGAELTLLEKLQQALEIHTIGATRFGAAVVLKDLPQQSEVTPQDVFHLVHNQFIQNQFLAGRAGR